MRQIRDRAEVLQSQSPKRSDDPPSVPNLTYEPLLGHPSPVAPIRDRSSDFQRLKHPETHKRIIVMRTFVKRFRGNESVSAVRQLLRNLRGKIRFQYFGLYDANPHQGFVVVLGLPGTHGCRRKQIASAPSTVDA
jgi:hypothetical protein